MNQILRENLAPEKVALWAWRDLAGHWNRAKPVGALLWPFWLAFAVLAFALLDGVSLAFDVEEAHEAARLDPHVIAFFEIVTRAGKSDWLFALSILTLVYALFRRAGRKIFAGGRNSA